MNGMLSHAFTLFSSLSRKGIGAAAAGSLVAWPSAAANTAPAGTIIESSAKAEYEEAGVLRTVTSNTVQVRVDELLGVAAASLDAGPLAVRIGPQVLSFVVSNTGNGPEAFALEVVTAVAGNGFDAAFDSFAIDGNGNGAYDPGVDVALPAPSVTASLAAGGTQTLFVLVTIPGGVTDGAQSAVNLIARAATGTGTPGTAFAGAGESGGDAVVGPGAGMATATTQLVASASSVTLIKWASVSDPFGGSSGTPGATITYGIAASVTGSAPVDALVVTDAIPDGTRYIPGSLNLDSAALTDAAGDDAGEASAGGISVTLGTVPGGTSKTVTFAVLVEE